MLQSIGVLPQTDSTEVVKAYNYVLDQYNKDAAEPADSIPTLAVFVTMKDVAKEAWEKFLQQIDQNEEWNSKIIGNVPNVIC